MFGTDFVCYNIQARRVPQCWTHSISTCGCLWLKFLQVGWSGMSLLHACWFSCRMRMATSCLITLTMIPLQIFQWQWYAVLLPWAVQHLPSHTAFSIHITFCRFAVVCAYPSLVMSTVHGMPVQNIQSLSTTAVIHTHAAPQMADTHPQSSAGWHPSTPENWITTVWSCLDAFTTLYIFNLHCHDVCISS